MQTRVSETITEMTGKIRAHTNLPIAVGFGISNAEQARMVAANADAIVVGSAVVNQIAQLGRTQEMVEKVAGFVREIGKGVNPRKSG